MDGVISREKIDDDVPLLFVNTLGDHIYITPERGSPSSRVIIVLLLK